jgi:hypothetical protein
VSGQLDKSGALLPAEPQRQPERSREEGIRAPENPLANLFTDRGGDT